MAKSPRIAMPLLSAGQAQKEISHNEALILIDSLLHASSAGAPSDTPPQSPELGLCYICGSSPTGAWVGHAKGLACWTTGGWRFVEPFEGLQVADIASAQIWRFASGTWSLGVVKASEVHINDIKVLGAQQPAIAEPSGGTTVDAEARSALSLVLEALRTHGLIAGAG